MNEKIVEVAELCAGQEARTTRTSGNAIDEAKEFLRLLYMKAGAVYEVVLVFLGFFLLIKYLEATPVGVIQYRLVGYDFFAHLVMAAIPVGLILLRRERFADYGLQRGQLKDQGVRQMGRVAFVELMVIWLFFGVYLLSSKGYQIVLVLPPKFFAETWPIPQLGRDLIGWSLTLVFELVFCGVGEEIFFRGYIQGRINKTFGRPWRVLGVNVGWGFIISALVFGIGHGLGTFNPFYAYGITRFNFDFSAAAATFSIGLLLGLLRDYTKGIAAPALLHASVLLFFGAFSVVK